MRKQVEGAPTKTFLSCVFKFEERNMRVGFSLQKWKMEAQIRNWGQYDIESLDDGFAIFPLFEDLSQSPIFEESD